MRYLLLFLLPIFVFSKPFKVATYNVENLFDAEYVGTEYDDYTVKHNWTQRMVDIKLNHTAEVICDLDADILGLQEIENDHILQQLMTRLKRVGCPYGYSAITHKKNAPIQVALLSRYPIAKQNEIAVSTAAGVRNILEVEVDIKGTPLTLFVNHWKSKAYHGYESKRIKYAKALQSRIAQMPETKEYIILGDFNSDHNAYLTLENKINDTYGKTAFNDVLKTKVGAYLVEEEEMLKADKGVHYTLWKELPVDQRWSHKFYGKKSSLDQIVLPRQMFDGQGVDYVNNSFKVFKRSYLFTKRGYINKWEYKNGKHRAKGYSDHLPVYAYFDTKSYIAEEKKRALKRVETKSIEDLYNIEALEGKIKLENVVVVLKRGRNAVVKQRMQGRGIYLYGCAGRLQEGHKYDLLVEGIKTYHGLKEITHAYSLKDKGVVESEQYMLSGDTFASNEIPQNEVLKEISGIYKNKFLYFNDKKVPLYFKKKKFTPANGSRLKIHYAHLGYYKKLQVVIYNKKDFEILE
ncbi:endonuclease/exonuclease/phosphatase family protein [Sulfurovum sp. XGS-02]|uniref:endonuclease/exonuclease/phosphatase family protein n=1 Tax=Sulfurovum sp. XGS-02 TaxID=2925411 RepID=UPI002060418A|nr:endonuclease/exonuclease/phosphatase family protein [Sulfurovum sp. XGS-02]UPT77068.1 endonuclease/exonuclease/phosphatase family protein [Sulfurovum sp. XGS-02]